MLHILLILKWVITLVGIYMAISVAVNMICSLELGPIDPVGNQIRHGD